MAVRILNWRGERNDKGQIAAASFICPRCNNRCWTGAHEIKDEGLLHPIIVCDHDCGFAEFVQLAGWCHGPIPSGGPK